MRTGRNVVLDGGCETIQHADGRGSVDEEEVRSRVSKGSEDKGKRVFNRGEIAVEGACVPTRRKGAQAWVKFEHIRAVDVAADGEPADWRGTKPGAPAELPGRRSRQPVVSAAAADASRRMLSQPSHSPRVKRTKARAAGGGRADSGGVGSSTESLASEQSAAAPEPAPEPEAAASAARAATMMPPPAARPKVPAATQGRDAGQGLEQSVGSLPDEGQEGRAAAEDKRELKDAVELLVELKQLRNFPPVNFVHPGWPAGAPSQWGVDDQPQLLEMVELGTHAAEAFGEEIGAAMWRLAVVRQMKQCQWLEEDTVVGRLRHELAEAKLTVERAGRMCAVAERSLGAARLKQAEAEQALAAAEQEKK